MQEKNKFNRKYLYLMNEIFGENDLKKKLQSSFTFYELNFSNEDSTINQFNY